MAGKNERASTNSTRCSIFEVYFINFMFRLLLCSLDENHGPSFVFFSSKYGYFGGFWVFSTIDFALNFLNAAGATGPSYPVLY